MSATKGPWKWYSDIDVYDLLGDNNVCVLQAPDVPPSEADAELIAAAPELLDLVEKLFLRDLFCDDPTDITPFRPEMRVLLKRLGRLK